MVTLVSKSATGALGDGHSGENALTISGDGNIIGFWSGAYNLYPGNNLAIGGRQIDLVDVTTGVVAPIRYVTVNTGLAAEAGYGQLAMTPDAHFVAFVSTSVELVPADTTTDADVFVQDILGGGITIESNPVGGAQSYHNSDAAISDDGRYVVFSSMDNLVATPDDNTSSNTDVYWKDRTTNELRMVSGSFDGTIQGDSGGADCDSSQGSVTNDGRYVVFTSSARNFGFAGDTNNSSDVFVRDMQDPTGSGGFYLISADAGGNAGNGSSYEGQITPDGHYVIFSSGATNLIAGDMQNAGGIFRYDLTTGDMVRVDTHADGTVSDARGFHGQISPDGRYVVFESTATQLVVAPNDSNALSKVFVKDMVTGQVAMVSRTEAGAVGSNWGSYGAQISDDGKFIVFNTRSALVAGDTNDLDDVYRVENPLFVPTGYALISSSFASSAEGWTVSGDAQGTSVLPTFQAAGGQASSGHVSATDNVTGGTWYWQAPVAYHGNLLGAYGQNLSFFLKQSSIASQFDADDIIIEGAGHKLTFNTPSNPGTAWTFYSVGLTETAGWIDTATGVTVSQTVMQQTLQAVTNLFIRGEFVTGADSGGLDEVAIGYASGANDTIDGLYFSDAIDGLAGNDLINGYEGADSLSGGLGNDTIHGGYGDDTIRGGDQGDTLYGEDSNDLISAGKGQDLLDGGAGNDTLTGGIGNDTLNGSLGIDTADYSTGSDGVTVSLATGVGGSTVPVAGVGSGTDVLTGIENIVGSAYNDVLAGNDVANVLDGGAGNDNLSGGLKADILRGGLGNDTLAGGQGMDTISGGDGSDILKGALGTDVLTGGAGADLFQFTSALDGVLNIDTITDFTSGLDAIQLSASVFTAFAAQVGQTIGLGARLTYTAASGVLAYDADGAGAGAPVTFAILGVGSHPATLGTDFQIIA